MCEINNTLTLCTCDDEVDTSQPHWILRRCDPNQPENNAISMGKLKFPKFDSNLVNSLCRELASRNCFDFDYKPFEGDTLAFNTLDTRIVLKFTSGGWGYDMPSFERPKLYTKASGYINNI
ncbi:hypothetical protein [Thalassomonas sp. M1454]|uniref:hypothetical protein n=1 Tax=Thalassomonas sp. M1454 TaxID=2594477 RepID=UPI00117CB640|nr:hypothetical protein [Thalassomonas sp. M1454]TRX56702.1 hypothetical protein FNN08_04015 [Thalassomonas sp. M1454]